MKLDVETCLSPNFNERRVPIDMLVLHYTGMESADAAIERLRDEDADVSAHYVVREDGHILRLVPEDKRAWHAGRGSWQGREDINSRSIGIEIVNGGHDFADEDGLPPYPEAQIAAVVALCANILTRHPIPAPGVVGHSDIAPLRKQDPGEHFPWERLAAAGIGLWPPVHAGSEAIIGRGIGEGDSGAGVIHLQGLLKTIGYGVTGSGQVDDMTRASITAFQRRFLPDHLTGQADMPTLMRLIAVADLYAAKG